MRFQIPSTPAEEVDLLLKTRPYNEQDGTLHLNPTWEDDPVRSKPDELITDRLDYRGFDFCLYRLHNNAVYAVRLLSTDTAGKDRTPEYKELCVYSEHGYRFWPNEAELRAAIEANMVHLDTD